MVARATDTVRSWPPYAWIAAVAALVGILLTRGAFGIGVAAALSGGLLLVLAMQALGFRALTIWVVVGVIAYPFIRIPQQHAQLTFDRLWIVGLAAAMLLTAPSRVGRTRESRRVATWIGAFVFAMVLRGALTSGQQRVAVELAVDTVLLPAVLFIAARRMVRGTDDWDRLAGSFTAAGAILGLLATAERVIGFQLATLSGGTVTTGSDVGVRVSGPYPSDDALAVALLMCLAATLLWMQASPRRRWIGASAVALELAGVAFTFFRGAWIAALVVIVVAVGLRPRRYARLLGTVALVGVLASVLFVQARGTQSLSLRLNNTQNVYGRIATWREAIELFARHPLAGVGLGQFATAQKNELEPVAVGGVSAASFAHNSYLDLLSEGGLLAFVPFLVLTIAGGQMVHRFRKVGRGERYDILIGSAVAAAGIGYIVMSLDETVITSSTASNAFLAILLGGCAGRLDTLMAGERGSDGSGDRAASSILPPSEHPRPLVERLGSNGSELRRKPPPPKQDRDPPPTPAQLLVALGGDGDDAARHLREEGADVNVVSVSELFARAARGDSSLKDTDLGVVGARPGAAIGTSPLTLAAARLRPRAVIEFDQGLVRGRRRPLSRYLAHASVPTGTQLLASGAAVAAQRLLARRTLAVGVPPAERAARIERVTYLRPVAGTTSPVGGSVTHSHGVIRALRRLGLEVEALTTDPRIVETAAVDDELCAWQFVPIPDRWRAVPASVAFGGDVSLRSAAVPSARRSQLVYQRHNRFSLVGALVARASRRPLFLEYNGSEAFFDQAWHESPMGHQLEVCEQASLRAATRIVVNSRQDYQSLRDRDIPAERLILSANGVEVDRFACGGGPELRRALSVAEDEVLLGFVGSFAAWHGGVILAEAFLAARSAGAPVRILLVGDGPERGQIEDLVNGGGAGDRAIFTGYVRPSMIPQHLDACDVLLSPHVPMPGGTEFFGSPTKLFEYMAAGKAIVASRIGQIAEVLEHGRTGLLVTPGDVDALARMIVLLAEDPQLRGRLGTTAREQAIAKHSWQRNGQALVDAYKAWSASPNDPC